MCKEKITAEQLEKELSGLRTALVDSCDDNYLKYKDDTPEMEHLFIVAEWLGRRLKDHGVEKSQQDDICCAAGQRCAAASLPMRIGGASDKDVCNMFSNVVADSWNRWTDGDIDKPGKELAQKLIKEHSWTDKDSE